MTPPRLLILDIGATLVTGPSRGPASRIAELAGLDGAQKKALHEALMTRPFERPDEVAAFARELVAGDRAGAGGAGAGAGGAQADRFAAANAVATGAADREAVAISEAVATVWTAQLTEARPIDGAAAALDALAASGIRLALISNIWAPYLHAARRCFGAFFDAHVAPELQLFSYREGAAKPAAVLFERVLERAGVAPEEAMMAGDSYAEDLAPAIALGLRTTWVLHRPEREAEHLARVRDGSAAAPTHTIATVADLPSAVDTRGAAGAPAVR